MGWRLGHRRKADVTEKEVLKVLSRLKNHLDQGGHRDGCSIRAVARDLGKSDATIRRWLSGMDWPSKEDLGNLVKFITE
jgi:hypothetical protein